MTHKTYDSVAVTMPVGGRKKIRNDGPPRSTQDFDEVRASWSMRCVFVDVESDWAHTCNMNKANGNKMSTVKALFGFALFSQRNFYSTTFVSLFSCSTRSV